VSEKPASWVDGRAEFHSVFSDLARGKRNWQLIAFGLLAVAGYLAIAYHQLASESRITPYVVEVDALGRAASFGPAEKIDQLDDRIVVATLSTLVRDLRTVFSDPAAQKELLYRAYAHVSGSARASLDTSFARPENDPRLLAQRLKRRVEAVDVLRLPNSSTWKVRWTEVEEPLLPGPVHRTAWEAFFTVAIDPPTSPEVVQLNPLGIYVTAANWTQISASAQGDRQP
jgi:type IV secretory pathway TrbF-like protein